jgi:hypothetical protein
VERRYSRGLYPLLQRALTSASNHVPFALFDVLWMAAAAVCAAAAYRQIRGAGWRAGGLRLAALAAGDTALLYLVFLATWGLNYRRVPLAEKLAFDQKRITRVASSALGETNAMTLNALYATAHAQPESTASLARAFNDAVGALGAARPFVPGRPKPTLLGGYFHEVSVAGMTDPFFLETLTASDLLPFERTFVIAHEWAHLAGYANEGEANFVGWITCLRGDEAQQYSGWLFLYGEVAATLPRRERGELFQGLDAGPRADLAASADRIARNASPRVAQAGWRVYNQYLKANRVESGTLSYTEVVRLILGTRYNAEAMQP